jgi:hypothetical protein
MAAAAAAATTPVDPGLSDDTVVTKYKLAAEISNRAFGCCGGPGLGRGGQQRGQFLFCAHLEDWPTDWPAQVC